MRAVSSKVTPGSLSSRVWDTAKISGRFASRHCLCSDFAAELGEPALDLGRDRRELLGARTELVHQLRRELGVFAEQFGGVGRGERRVHAREAALQDVASDGVLQPRQALDHLEAFLLRLENGRERLTSGGNHGAGVESAVDHGLLRCGGVFNEQYSTQFCMHCKRKTMARIPGTQLTCNLLISKEII